MPLLLSCILGSCLDLERLLVLLFVVGSSRLAVVGISLLPAVADEITPLPAVTAGLSFSCHGYATTSDLPTSATSA